jgi:hypothetical protein
MVDALFTCQNGYGIGENIIKEIILSFYIRQSPVKKKYKYSKLAFSRLKQEHLYFFFTGNCWVS